MKNGTVHSLVLLLTLSFYSQANLIVSVVKVPEEPNGTFSARVSGGENNDRTPNPCYWVSNCELRFFTIDERWLPAGQDQYLTVDKGDGFYTPLRTSDYETLGQWWADVENKFRVGEDNLSDIDPRPCVVVAASIQYRMIAGTIVSNCAKGIVQAPSCHVSPNTIDVRLAADLGHEVPATRVDNVSISCSQDTSIVIETNTGEKIALGGSSVAVAILDWGAGFGKPYNLKLKRNTATPLPLRVMTSGLGSLDAGVFHGSAVINVSYN